MKKLIPFLCLVVCFIACKKTMDGPYQSKGVITGYDAGMCQMCNGLNITILNDTTKNAPSHYEINSSLQQLGINPNAKFPINVYLNWMHDTSTVGVYRFIIVVNKIKVIN